MKNIITYDNVGCITGSFSVPDEDVALMVANQNFIYGKAGINNYIHNGVIKTFPEQPNPRYVFNYNTEQWEISIEDLKIEITLKRNQLLLDSDWTQLPNNPLTPEQQTAWATYRQQLRDITSQPGYPTNVVWPVQPE